MKQLNTQQKMDILLEDINSREMSEGKASPVLFLHSCCAPCSSYVLEYLSQYFTIYDFFYNPNITEESEYHKRFEEIARLIVEQPHKYPVTLVEGEYEPKRFLELAKGLEDLPEGGERCRRCFELRLAATARMAREYNADYFATTLTISPLKNAELINRIGEDISAREGIPYLASDFKKKNGYLRSIQLSKEYGLYRQDYCGCPFSKANKER